jgi:hypothetical protein
VVDVFEEIIVRVDLVLVWLGCVSGEVETFLEG